MTAVDERHPLIQTERPPEHVFEEFRRLHGICPGPLCCCMECNEEKERGTWDAFFREQEEINRGRH